MVDQEASLVEAADCEAFGHRDANTSQRAYARTAQRYTYMVEVGIICNSGNLGQLSRPRDPWHLITRIDHDGLAGT